MKTSIALILCIVGLVVALLACEQPQDSAPLEEETFSSLGPPSGEVIRGLDETCAIAP